MRRSFILAALAVFVCLFGCRSKKDESVPDALIGVWKTSAPGYEDNSLELRKDEILFGQGHSKFSDNSIFEAETIQLPDQKTLLITIHYTDEEGKDNVSSFFYDRTPPVSIRFKNQMQIKWELFEPKPPGKVSLSRHRPAASWWEGYDSEFALALLGVAMVTVGFLWRWQESKAGRAGATIKDADPGPAERMAGGGEFNRIRAAEGDADWTQAPATIPAIAASEQRRSERILLKIPVRVAGIDAQGKSFGERTSTFTINRHGAFLWLKNSPREGDQIIVTHLGTGQSCAFRLCESAQDRSSQVTAWGIECLEPNANFWQIRFPDKPTEPSPEKIIVALIVCGTCNSREVADLSVTQYRNMLERGSMERDCMDCGAATEWNFILVEATAVASRKETPAVRLPSGEENRREKRIVAKLPILLRHPEDGRVESTFTENVSKSGVCCVASMDLNVRDVILLTFESGTGPNEDENPARIMWRRALGQNRILYGIRLKRKEL